MNPTANAKADSEKFLKGLGVMISIFRHGLRNAGHDFHFYLSFFFHKLLIFKLIISPLFTLNLSILF